jgi:hypothetical protein
MKNNDEKLGIVRTIRSDSKVVKGLVLSIVWLVAGLVAVACILSGWFLMSIGAPMGVVITVPIALVLCLLISVMIVSTYLAGIDWNQHI